MKMRTTRLALLAVALAAGGCKDDIASLQLAAVCLPPDSDCLFSDTCDAQSIGIAMLDTGLSDSLWLTVQVNNLALNNEDEDTFRGNSRDAYIEEVVTEFEAPFPIGPTSARVGPYLVPAGGSAVVSLFPITPGAVAEIDAVGIGTTPVGIIAKMRAKGQFQDETEFETAPMELAVDLCDGCIDPNPCVSGVLTSVCPPNRNGLFGRAQVPQSVTCE